MASKSATASTLRARSAWRVFDGFGRAMQSASRFMAPRTSDELAALMARASEERLPITFRGSGRSYGDASLGDGGLAVDLRQMNRMLDWNPVDGIAEVEPGLTVEGLWRRTIEDGYWPLVVPGTMAPTMGGCLGMNIHGKNNFRVGPFGEHVLEFDLLTPDGSKIRCTPEESGDLFRAVIGGAGLLGAVTRVKLRLKKIESGLLRVEPLVARDFNELVDRFEERLPRADYLVGWLDCFARHELLGRGIIHQANYLHADEDAEGPTTLHIERQVLPSTILGLPRRWVWRFMRPLMNDRGVQLLNIGKYYAACISRPGSSYLQSHVGFAFLLDYVPNWRLAYGKSGFAQYQLFVPKEAVRTLVPDLLRLCQERGVVSYLGVFKRHRPDNFLLSHAVDGYSLALDFPMHDPERLQSLAREMTARVLDVGGRFYLAKDSLLRPDELRRAYGDQIARFLTLKERLDPHGLLTSQLARRLELTLDGRACRAVAS
jgi:decaprenylphospho-beta-D-ribofuranose 2-oxidase